ncbi:hypothetical protein VTI74DRAFT_1916 [Chaetomium olivicolor]
MVCSVSYSMLYVAKTNVRRIERSGLSNIVLFFPSFFFFLDSESLVIVTCIPDNGKLHQDSEAGTGQHGCGADVRSKVPWYLHPRLWSREAWTPASIWRPRFTSCWLRKKSDTRRTGQLWKAPPCTLPFPPGSADLAPRPITSTVGPLIGFISCADAPLRARFFVSICCFSLDLRFANSTRREPGKG